MNKDSWKKPLPLWVKILFIVIAIYAVYVLIQGYGA